MPVVVEELQLVEELHFVDEIQELLFVGVLENPKPSFGKSGPVFHCAAKEH